MLLHTPDTITADGLIPAVRSAGGKGSNLYWLQVHGFNVPSTWVLGTAAFELMIENNKITRLVREIDQATASSCEWAAAQGLLDSLEPKRQAVIEALDQAALPSQVQVVLGCLPSHALWAVRSSATVEDTTSYSFAGQFASHLSVPGSADPLERAVRSVWCSTFKREVLAYRLQFGAPMPHMAVILQPMQPITAQDRSGVAFSHSTVPTMPGVLIQASFGAGHTVVKGRGGDIYAVQGNQARVHLMPPPDISVTGEQGGEVSAPAPSGAVLSTDNARLVARQVLTMAEQWGGPVNVEFAWYAQEPAPLYVQVRSITGEQG